jgi:hypothetical protein
VLIEHLARLLEATSAGVIFAAAIFGQDVEKSTPRVFSAEEIIQCMLASERARTAELREYTAVRRYSLDNRRFNKDAAMTVHMKYRHPDHKEFSIVAESGPAVIRGGYFIRCWLPKRNPPEDHCARPPGSRR